MTIRNDIPSSSDLQKCQILVKDVTSSRRRDASWTAMHGASGADLWRRRAKAFPRFKSRASQKHEQHNQDDGGEDDPIGVLAPLDYPAISIPIWPSSRPSRLRSSLQWIKHKLFRSQQYSKSTRRTVVMGCPHLFQTMEDEYGMDKPPPRTARPRPLTQCLGDEWVIQRRLITQAFQDLPQHSLRAAQTLVVVRDVLPHARKDAVADITTSSPANAGCWVVDLKEYCVVASISWAVGLFRGRRDAQLQRACRDFWETSRSYTPVSAAIVKAKRDAFVRSFVWDNEAAVGIKGGGEGTARRKKVDARKLSPADKTPRVRGLLTTLQPNISSLSVDEANDNAVNAMIAAHDAVQALLFWTLWNLSKSKQLWDEARQIALACSFIEVRRPGSLNTTHGDESYSRSQYHAGGPSSTSTYNTDLEGLAEFKRTATKGKLVDYSRLSVLGRALCETVRVFPPVWTLPRTWPGSIPEQEDATSHIYYSKLDVVTVNGAISPRDWDPNGAVALTPRSTRIASFGLGKRACPAGTSALYAIYHLLTQTLVHVKNLEEKTDGSAVDDLHLLPTLNLVGPQLFSATIDQNQDNCSI